MFLSRLLLNQSSREVRRDLADCQQFHRTIMSAFPHVETAGRAGMGVLFRVEAKEGRLVLLVQSKVAPDWTGLPPGYCLPGGVACKPVNESYGAITDGMVLRFRLRANPTKRLKAGCPGEKRDGPRVDLRREGDQLAWLSRKAELGGFRLLDVSVGSGIPDVPVKDEPGRVHGRHVAGKMTFGAVLFEGRLQVQDARLFRQTMEAGIGSGKAYGFGLLSIGPA